MDDDHGKDCDRSSDDFDRTCNFTLTHKKVETFEPEPYEDPSDADIARQRNPVGTVSANPRSRTTDYTVPARTHCGEAYSSVDNTDRDQVIMDEYYMGKYDDPVNEKSVDHDNDPNTAQITVYKLPDPVECVLADPGGNYHPIVWHDTPTEEN
ncbi:MAG: hypothetical protein F4Y75_03880, partial [Acidimicrobiia bacterium]|nr:hypothetical protein [Acidimicrobiia bacterium]